MITRLQPIDRNAWEQQGLIEATLGSKASTGVVLQDYLETMPDFALIASVTGWDPYTHVARATDPLRGEATYFLVRSKEALLDGTIVHVNPEDYMSGRSTP